MEKKLPIKYESIVPWGRNFDEYCRMFALSEQDLRLRILDCAGGPSSFNVECNEKNGQVISLDPIYQFSKEKIQARIAETYEEVLQTTIANKDKYIWKHFGSPMQLGSMRMATMRKFLADFPQGKMLGRYVVGELPKLSFKKDRFDLALCSHFLFLYSENLDYQFHAQSIKAMLEVAREVRIFPLVDHNGKKSVHLKKILEEFRTYKPLVRKVDYDFQIGANEVLILTNPAAPKNEEDDFYKQMRRKYG